MTRPAALVVLGALAVASLAACSDASPDAGSTSDFCGVSDTLESFGGMSANFPSEIIMAEAEAGDMNALHEWGDAKSESFAANIGDLERAKDAAPSDDVARALDVLIANLEPLASVYSAASEAHDLDAFLGGLESIPGPDEDSDAKASAALDAVTEAETTFCT